MKLIDKAEAVENLALLAKNGPLQVEITEDIAFKHEGDLHWIPLGEINFFPAKPSQGDEPYYDYWAAVRYGGFEWKLPNASALKEAVFNFEAIPKLEDNHKEKLIHAVREGLQDILRRTLVQYPVFDAATMAMLPLQRPATIVPDTSAVHQGALDFICRFLMPWARIKVPAIIHMEILNNADNYFKIRFGPKVGQQKSSIRPRTLRQHILSQGGQRTLLRMEFNPEVELDRGDLGADPLRGIVTPSSDSEDKALGLQHITRSFADRLVVETARRFQFQTRPDRPLFLLTSDQGMARMAMAEGLGVMFFQARAVPQFEGRTVTGALLAPFSAEIHTVSFADILWELAVSFGRARISTISGSQGKLDLWGIGGEGATWQPLHAREDLLWANIAPPARSSQPQPLPPSEGPHQQLVVESTRPTQPLQTSPEELKSSYKFSPDRLFALVGALVKEGRMTATVARECLALRSQDTLRKYVRFLVSGRLVQDEGDQLRSTNKLAELWQALSIGEDIKTGEILRTVPSFNELWEFVASKGQVDSDDSNLPTVVTARPNYFALGEGMRAWVSVTGHGIVYTPSIPPCGQFAKTAMSVYSEISRADSAEWILTGKWLEKLAFEYGIHPVTVRELTGQSRQEELMRVFAEGSTPDNRFETHTFWTLSTQGEMPHLERAYFYRGDFLLPGTAAVRIKIEVSDHAS